MKKKVLFIGGLTAIYLAARHPERVRKLVLEEAVSKYMRDIDPKGFETRKKFYDSQYGYMRYFLKILARVAPRSLARVTMSIFGTHDPDEAVKRMSKADIDALCSFYLRWQASWDQAAARSQGRAFNDPEWIFDMKCNGFRSLAYVESERCRLISRCLLLD